VAGALAGACL